MLTPEQIEYFSQCVAAYVADTEMQLWLEKHQGITFEEGLKHEVGWDPKHQRFVIPVRGVKGDYLEIKGFFLHDEGNWLEEVEGGYEDVDLAQSVHSLCGGSPGGDVSIAASVIGWDPRVVGPFGPHREITDQGRKSHLSVFVNANEEQGFWIDIPSGQ